MHSRWGRYVGILLVSAILLTMGCSLNSKETAPSNQTPQTIQDDVHAHISGLYRVPVPVEDFTGGTMTEDRYSLLFTDDFGRLYRIENVPLPPKDQANLEEMGLDGFLDYFLSEVFMKLAILEYIPAASIDYREKVPERFGGALYTRLNLPGGSVLVKQTAGSEPKRLDANRGVLLFLQNKTLYIISVGMMEVGFTENPDQDELNRRKELLKTKTLEFADTIEFLEKQTEL